ncbi:hypothetical protein GGR54DRAFT_639753 [Hypoxylon sp. NC1633]|nr:hypothetical protein GGR54DRAFT_639753 [Hypoxylon sp. NC1633]
MSLCSHRKVRAVFDCVRGNTTRSNRVSSDLGADFGTLHVWGHDREVGIVKIVDGQGKLPRLRLPRNRNACSSLGDMGLGGRRSYLPSIVVDGTNAPRTNLRMEEEGRGVGLPFSETQGA